MLNFARCFRKACLVAAASLVAANFVGLVAAVGAQQSQQSSMQGPGTSAEAAAFDAFLDAHPDIDAQLRINPLLINDQNWLHDHPEVLLYFDRHPQAKTEIAGSLSYFIRRESRRADREARQESENLRKRGIADFQQFLNSNPQIAKELNANPTLIKEPRYVDQHPGLQAFLYDHPQVSQDLRANPSWFVQRASQQSAAAKKEAEDQTVRRPQKQAGNAPASIVANREQHAHGPSQAIDAANFRAHAAQHAERPSRPQVTTANGEIGSFAPHPSIGSTSVLTASEIASFDQFLGEHRKISQDLEKDPARVKDYVKKNKDLKVYLNQHPAVREELTQSPAYFMNRRNRYELSAAERSNSPNSASSIARLSQKDLRATDRFLEKHKNINKDLGKNPSLAVDPHYLKKHREFREFLEQNPDINAAVRNDPVAFMQNQHDRFAQMHQKM